MMRRSSASNSRIDSSTSRKISESTISKCHKLAVKSSIYASSSRQPSWEEVSNASRTTSCGRRSWISSRFHRHAQAPASHWRVITSGACFSTRRSSTRIRVPSMRRDWQWKDYPRWDQEFLTSLIKELLPSQLRPQSSASSQITRFWESKNETECSSFNSLQLQGKLQVVVWQRKRDTTSTSRQTRFTSRTRKLCTRFRLQSVEDKLRRRNTSWAICLCLYQIHTDRRQLHCKPQQTSTARISQRSNSSTRTIKHSTTLILQQVSILPRPSPIQCQSDAHTRWLSRKD